MRSALTAALAASALTQQVVATLDWTNANVLSTPANTNNECTADQQSGFNWQGLSTGTVSTFGGFDFSGFTCNNAFTTKRSIQIRDDFQV
jgi:hypothetical protein